MRLPIRRWVLSVPFALRFLLARAPHVISAALGVVARAIANHLVHQAGFTAATALIRFVGWNDKRRPYPVSWDEQDLLFKQMPKHLVTKALILLVVGDTETPLSIARKPPEILAGRVFGMWAGILAVIERRQDALEHGWVFERGNHVHLPAAGRTGFYLDLEHPLQALGLRLIAA